MKTFFAFTTGLLSGFVGTCAIVAWIGQESRKMDNNETPYGG